ncbi:MAG: hypothetical protein WD398_15895 [Cyclobacteriaceae bacterium]
MLKINIQLILFCIFIFPFSLLFAQERGEVGTFGDQFIWTGTGEAFVPNYIMMDVLGKELHEIKPADIDYLIEEFMIGHGFNGIHVPVLGRWFHLESNDVTEADSIPDPETTTVLAMIIKKVYDAGGSTYLWLWGDAQRGWTSKSTKDGIMGKQEQRLLDHIAETLGPSKGWMLGYGFDLWEWVGEKDYSEEETLRGLWHHTMAGGIGAIWGNLNGDGIYGNKEALKCYGIFWNENRRFKKGLVVDNAITDGFCLRESDRSFVFYKENTQKINYQIEGQPKKVIAVDTRKPYHELDQGIKRKGQHQFEAPYPSDWALAVE